MILTISIFVAILLSFVYFAGRISKKNLCFWIAIMTFLILGLRSTTTGGDTYQYYNDFLSINIGSLPVTIKNSDIKDIGFIVFEWFIKRIGGTFRTVLLINGLLFGTAIGKALYKYSDEPGLSYVLLFSFNFFQFCLSGLRQTFSISFFIFALMLYEDKKYLKSIVLLLLAGAFHLSAFILVVIPIIQLLFKNPDRIKYSIPIILIVFILRNQIATILNNILFAITDRMSFDIILGDAGLTMTIVIMIIYAFSALFAGSYCRENKQGVMDFALMSFAVFFETLVPAQPIFFRVAFYTIWAIAMSVPKVICVVFEGQFQHVVKLFTYSIALIMYFGFTMNSVIGGYHLLG